MSLLTEPKTNLQVLDRESGLLDWRTEDGTRFLVTLSHDVSGQKSRIRLRLGGALDWTASCPYLEVNVRACVRVCDKRRRFSPWTSCTTHIVSVVLLHTTNYFLSRGASAVFGREIVRSTLQHSANGTFILFLCLEVQPRPMLQNDKSSNFCYLNFKHSRCSSSPSARPVR